MAEPSREKPYVLDASALLCVLFSEPGAEHVAERLSRGLVSEVNYREVLVMLIDRGVDPIEAKAMLGELDVEIIANDTEQATVGSTLQTAACNAGLSTGDRSCLALAQTRHAIAVTCNRNWKGLDINLEIEVVR